MLCWFWESVWQRGSCDTGGGSSGRSYGIPEKIVKMVKAVYNGSESAVIDGSGVYDWFENKTGVKQGCCTSGFLFLLVVDWVLRKATEYGNTGIRWKFSSFLEDLDFADDLPLISSRREHIQTKVNNLGRYAKMTGLTISTTWCIWWDGTTSKPKRFKLIEKNWKRWWNLFI